MGGEGVRVMRSGILRWDFDTTIEVEDDESGVIVEHEGVVRGSFKVRRKRSCEEL